MSPGLCSGFLHHLECPPSSTPQSSRLRSPQLPAPQRALAQLQPAHPRQPPHITAAAHITSQGARLLCSGLGGSLAKAKPSPFPCPSQPCPGVLPGCQGEFVPENISRGHPLRQQFSLGVVRSPGGIWQCLEIYWLSHLGGEVSCYCHLAGRDQSGN